MSGIFNTYIIRQTRVYLDKNNSKLVDDEARKIRI